MKILLNSRVLIGPYHDAGESFMQTWRGSENQIEWGGSPSTHCVLKVEQPIGLTALAGQFETATPVSIVPSIELSAERDLRSQPGLPSFEGDDSSESEVGNSPPTTEHLGPIRRTAPPDLPPSNSEQTPPQSSPQSFIPYRGDVRFQAI